MSGFKFSEKGMMLVTILMLTFLLVMLTTSMIFISSQNLNITGLEERKAKALQTAEAGVEYAFYQLYDTTWGTSITSNITENLGNDQKFTLVFNPSEPYHSRNNLMNKDPNGTTPPYSAEIISRGDYRGTQKIIRAIFVRDDMAITPLLSGGSIYLGAWANSPTTAIYNITSKNLQDPGRVHSNKKITIYGNGGTVVNLNDGFISCKSTAQIISVSGNIKKKEGTLPVKIPDIDIDTIVDSHEASSLSLPTDTFYLIGYFEYDANSPAYCIPHNSHVSTFTDPFVHTPTYKLGIVAFKENDYSHFISNYGDFYCNPYPTAPGGANRNFYKPSYGYDSTMRFYEFGTSDFSTIENELGMTMSPPDGSGNIILTLNRDLFIPATSTNGFFETCTITTVGYSGYGTIYYPTPMSGRRVKLNLNGHKIYGDKLYLGIGPYGTKAGSGIISKQTVDLLHSYDVNMIILSEKSVRLAYQGKYDKSNFSYNGIIYARDNISLQENNNCGGYTDETLNFNGMLVSNHNTGIQTSPMAHYPYILFPDSGIYLEPVGSKNVNISFTTTGFDTLVSLRGNDFKIRKHLSEIIK